MKLFFVNKWKVSKMLESVFWVKEAVLIGLFPRDGFAHKNSVLKERLKILKKYHLQEVLSNKKVEMWLSQNNYLKKIPN